MLLLSAGYRKVVQKKLHLQKLLLAQVFLSLPLLSLILWFHVKVLDYHLLHVMLSPELWRKETVHAWFACERKIDIISNIFFKSRRYFLTLVLDSPLLLSCLHDACFKGSRAFVIIDLFSKDILFSIKNGATYKRDVSWVDFKLHSRSQSRRNRQNMSRGNFHSSHGIQFSSLNTYDHNCNFFMKIQTPFSHAKLQKFVYAGSVCKKLI